ncbi:MAG: flavodoxin-dependent (E)-4-hydroxy-3-methylbut-2-enyl-diphosphate synthase [Planctomycetota bacterium]|nr:flavodoxin-dependent (E)-4-hydroxy-3-methylbut-2-enyl-diphosphate synthase [Planctomycetota bacterium]
MVDALQKALAGIKAPLTVAIMGCVVNGPGEADSADVAVCAGAGKAILYRRGQRLRTIPASEIVPAVLAEIAELTKP